MWLTTAPNSFQMLGCIFPATPLEPFVEGAHDDSGGRPEIRRGKSEVTAVTTVGRPLPTYLPTEGSVERLALGLRAYLPQIYTYMSSQYMHARRENSVLALRLTHTFITCYPLPRNPFVQTHKIRLLACSSWLCFCALLALGPKKTAMNP